MDAYCTCDRRIQNTDKNSTPKLKSSNFTDSKFPRCCSKVEAFSMELSLSWYYCFLSSHVFCRALSPYQEQDLFRQKPCSRCYLFYFLCKNITETTNNLLKSGKVQKNRKALILGGNYYFIFLTLLILSSEEDIIHYVQEKGMIPPGEKHRSNKMQKV